MASYIDWYTIELERRLAGKLPREEVFALVAETEDHLRQRSAEYGSTGMNAEESERTAAESFGKPEEIAFEAVESRVSPKTVRAGRLLALLGAICGFGGLVAGFGLADGWVVYRVVSPTMVAGIICLFVGSFMCRKWQWRSIMALAVCSTLVSIALIPRTFTLLLGRPTPIANLPLIRDAVKEGLADDAISLEALHRNADYYARLAAAHGDPKKSTGQPAKTREGDYIALSPQSVNYLSPSMLGVKSTRAYATPFDPMPGYYDTYPSRYPYYGESTARSLSDAAATWAMYEPQAEKNLKDRMKNAHANYDNILSAMARPSSLTWPLIWLACCANAGAAVTLIGINGFCVVFWRAFRRRLAARVRYA